MSTTHFGFEEIQSAQKEARVKGVFNRVAGSYDVMNDLMSAGTHRLWKAAMVDRLNPRPGMRVLDVAGGTGDIARRILKREPAASVLCCDINYAMLSEGRDRSIDKGVLRGIEYACGNAESLPFADGQFDACTIAFGLRNVTHTLPALAEMRRILKPGGCFLCLEFSPPGAQMAHDWLRKAYDWYSFKAIPVMGQKVAGDGEPYRYLVESIRRFHAPQKLEALMREAGFAQTSWRGMSGGIVSLHAGWRV